jgi:hypothetical protein
LPQGRQGRARLRTFPREGAGLSPRFFVCPTIEGGRRFTGNAHDHPAQSAKPRQR